MSSVVCVLIAGLTKHETSLDFQQSLNTLLVANKLPKISMGGLDPPNLVICNEDNNLKNSYWATKTEPEIQRPITLASTDETGSVDADCFLNGSGTAVYRGVIPKIRTVLADNVEDGDSQRSSTEQAHDGDSAIRVTRSKKTEGGDVSLGTTNPKCPVVRTVSYRDIKIYKCKGTKKVDAYNIKQLAASGKVFIESSANESKCIDMLLKKNVHSSQAFSNIIELPSDIFMKKLSANVSRAVAGSVDC